MNNRKVIESLSVFLETYTAQSMWEQFSEETIIHDIVYGMGTAIDDKYQFADWYKEWKEYLIKFLQDTEK